MAEAGARARARRATPLQRVEAWFAARGWKPFAYQRATWRAHHAGRGGLVQAATGTGKTYAVWIAALLEWMREERTSAAERTGAPPLRVLWVTPLRALAADTAAALRAPLEELGVFWTIETRTGDTPASVRARQRTRLPTALVTTPESLSLFLSRPDARELFADLRMIVVDEWHELLGSKRGVQVELALARLRKWRPEARTWGVSATIGNLEEALDTLQGRSQDVGPPGVLIRGKVPKVVRVDALLPTSVERFPWAGHMGRQLLPQVIAELESVGTALIFTNTRSQTEAWFHALLEARPDWAGVIALHHGSLDRKVRAWVEDGLRAGRLKVVVATSTLDLGVDFAPVERVLQIGSPKGVARLLQRAGRSGHAPGRPSRVTCVPTNSLELIEIAAARDAANAGRIEPRRPESRALDVLTQHLVTIALGGGFRADELYDEVRTTQAYHDLTPAEFQWALDFVVRGGPALTSYPEYSRVVERDGVYVVEDQTIARRHRMSIGTITDDAQIEVRFVRGARLGTIEEAFVSRMRRGDRFIFGGRVLEFVRIRDMVCQVRTAKSNAGAIPRWLGGKMPFTAELSAATRAKLDEAKRGIFANAEMRAVRPLLEVQRRWSALPAADELLIECVRTREGHHIFLFPVEGRFVHEGLAALLAYRLARLQPLTFSISADEYGIELLSREPAPLDAALEANLFSTADLLDDIHAALNATEMARRQFREIARVAGLIFPGLPHAGKTARQLQASASLFFDVFVRHDPGNLLVAQAHREVMQRQLESSRLHATLERIRASGLLITHPPQPTPLAFPLIVQRSKESVTSESLPERIRKMALRLESVAAEEELELRKYKKRMF